jgi:hypothetical protein
MGGKALEAALAAEAAGQWGMFTTAQALRLGLSRKAVARLATAGHVAHAEARGVYRFAGTPVEVMLDKVRSNWLSLSPGLFLRERLKTLRSNTWDDAVVSHLTAANYVYELGSRQPDYCDFTISAARRTRDEHMQFYVRTAKPKWHNVGGLPVTTIPQTIADLYVDNLDRGHLGDIVYDALLRRGVSLHDIATELDAVTDGRGRDAALHMLEIVGAPPEIVTASDLLYSATAG